MQVLGGGLLVLGLGFIVILVCSSGAAGLFLGGLLVLIACTVVLLFCC